MLAIPLKVLAGKDDTNFRAGCRDILLVYARGSGQNLDHRFIDAPFETDFRSLEAESSSFFGSFKRHLDADYPHLDYKAVTVHKFAGKAYSNNGYKAVPVGIPGQVPNIANAELSWLPGDYRNSVDQGINETVGYLKDQIANCPDQLIAVGGYSQGAQVIGDSLFRLTEQERSKIVGVGLFGDPKFIASSGDNLINPFDHHVSYPWRRGDATNNDRGMLDARAPYVPADIEKRVASYCYKADLVCAGWSGFRGVKDVAHEGYAGEATDNTVNEIMQWAAPKLVQIERQKGGKILADDESQAGTIPDDKQRDIMLLVNDDSNLSVLQALRYQLDPMLNSVAGIHPNTVYGMKAVEEPDAIPHFATVQALVAYTGYNPANPMFSVSNLQNSINKRYPFGQPYYGAGDVPNPIGIATEKAVLSTNWREDSAKQLVVFTDKPLKDKYAYSFCYQLIQERPAAPTSTTCPSSEMNTTSLPKTLYSEACKTVYMVITQDTCTAPFDTPNTVSTITRTTDDEIAIAQSQHVAVTVVVPYNVRARYTTQQSYDKAIQQLKQLAEATGGKFIYYDKATEYNKTLLQDTLYQIFGHTPKFLNVVYTDSSSSSGSPKTGRVLNASTSTPIVLDLSRTNQYFNSYKWDFNDDGQWDETSPGPVIEHKFTSPQTGFIRMAGASESGEVQVETKMAVAIVPANEPLAQPEAPTVPEVLATQKKSGEITLGWQASEEGYLLAIDPESHLPIAQAPIQDGSTTFNTDKPYTSLEIRVAVGDIITDVSIIEVKPEVIIPVITDPIPEDPPIEVTDPDPITPTEENTTPPVQQEPDPTLCYKLQQCQNESATPDSYDPQSIATTIGTTDLPIGVVSSRQDPQTISTTIQPQQAVQGVETTKTPQFVDNTGTTQLPARRQKQKEYNPLIVLLIITGMIILMWSIKNKLKRS